MLVDALVNIAARYFRRARKRVTKAASRQNVQRVLHAAGDSARRFIHSARAARRCPGCGSNRIVQPLAHCGKHRDRAGLFTAIVAAGCRECGLLFSSPQPSRRAVEKMYARQGKWESDHAQRNDVRKDGPTVDLLDHHIGLHRSAPASVLDVGCGAGRWLNTFADRGWSTFGIEPATKIAFSRHQELLSIPHEPTFDVVILHQVLEHLRRPGDMLKECAAALKPEGWLFISVPNLDGLPYHRDWYYCLNGNAHIAAFSHSALKRLLGRAGMRWWICLDDPRAVAERQHGTGRSRVLARKMTPAAEQLEAPSPLQDAIDKLREAGVLLNESQWRG